MSLLAWLVAGVHLAFIVFVVVGGLLAVRWPRVLWAHAPCGLYALFIVVVGWPCPLTGVENALRGDDAYAGGFIDHYLTGVLYPQGWETGVQLAAALLVVASYVTLLIRKGRSVLPWRGGN